jgi:hypothetical protein
MPKIEMEITFHPLSKNRYRCNQTGVIVFKSMIPAYTNSLLAAGKKAAEKLVVKPHHNQPKERSHEHSSTYRNKHQ